MEHKKADILSKIATLEFNSQMIKPNNTLSIISYLKSYYLSQETLPRFLEDEDSVLPMKIKDSYVNLAIITHRETKEKEEQLGRAKKESQLKEGFLADYESLHYPKEAIELRDIFLRERQATNAHKRLIYGRAGIGKSTLVHYAAYQWANDMLWPEFDYVFWLPLRKLTSDWKERYDKDELKANPLACFTHHCCPNNTIKVEAIISVLTQRNSNKILLLLDGYDEIAQLHDKNHSLISEVLNAAIKGSFYVLMTSRPNAVGSEVQGHFDAKFLETIGLTDNNITEYIEKNYQNITSDQSAAYKDGLLRFLEINRAVKG
ncbi:MAG: NACHT domain-containing protein, partial [Burkholderiales bacterium]